MRVPITAQLIGFMLCASNVSAQAFNLDFGGNELTRPTSSYGAASGQTGFWDTSGLGPFRDVAGTLTSVTMGTNGSIDSHEIPGATGDDERFMESVLEFSPSFTTTAFSNVASGSYDLFIYSWMGSSAGPDSLTFTVRNGVSSKVAKINNTSVWPGQHVEGETYAHLQIEVLSQFQFIGITFVFQSGFNGINGIQLIPVPAPATLSLFLAAPLAVGMRRRR